ncbi:MAG: hypothetical protein JWQ50_6783 [Caballeronia mineralivorans]|nr:hypothetical protein [Caballeronia mineralivorans]
MQVAATLAQYRASCGWLTINCLVNSDERSGAFVLDVAFGCIWLYANAIFRPKLDEACLAMAGNDAIFRSGPMSVAAVPAADSINHSSFAFLCSPTRFEVSLGSTRLTATRSSKGTTIVYC